jgi:hypothetical protein
MGKTTQRRINIVLKRKGDDYLANNLLVNIEGEIIETHIYEDVIAYFSGKKIGNLTCRIKYVCHL